MPDSQPDLLREILRHPLTWLFSGGGATLLAQGIFGRRKTNAEAKQVDAGAETTLSAGAIAFASELRKDIDQLQQRVEYLERENRELFRKLVTAENRVSVLEAENGVLRAKLSALQGSGEG